MAGNKARLYVLQFSVTVLYNTSGRQQLSARKDFTDASFIVIVLSRVHKNKKYHKPNHCATQATLG